MKKILTVLFCISIITVSLSACSNNNSNSPRNTLTEVVYTWNEEAFGEYGLPKIKAPTDINITKFSALESFFDIQCSTSKQTADQLVKDIFDSASKVSSITSGINNNTIVTSIDSVREIQAKDHVNYAFVYLASKNKYFVNISMFVNPANNGDTKVDLIITIDQVL